MRNGKTRFDYKSPNAVGPRQGLVLMLMAEQEVLTAAGAEAAFGCINLGDVFIALVRKGLIHVCATAPGLARGRPHLAYCLTAKGRAYVRRTQEIIGLGNVFAAVKGYRA